MKKLLLMFMLLFLSGGTLFANSAQFFSNTSINIVEEEEEEADDHDEEEDHEEDDTDHDDDEHDDDEKIEFDKEEFKKFLDENFGFAKKLWEVADEDEREEFVEEMEELFIEMKECEDDHEEHVYVKVEIMEIQSELMAELIRQTSSEGEKKVMMEKLSQHLMKTFDLKLNHLLIIGILSLSFSISFLIRSISFNLN